MAEVIAFPPNDTPSTARANYTKVPPVPFTDGNGQEWTFDVAKIKWSKYVAETVLDDDALAAIIATADEKTTPVDDDEVVILDSEDPTKMKRVKKSNLLTTVGTPFAELIIGTGNARVTYTAITSGSAGEINHIQYGTSTEGVTTEISFGPMPPTFVVSPGTKVRMTVSGTTSPNLNGTLEYAFPNCWTSGGAYPFDGVYSGPILYYDDLADNWVLTSVVAGVISTYYWNGGSGIITYPYPDTTMTWTTGEGATGAPVVTAGTSNAKQVRNAVNAWQDALYTSGATPKLILATLPDGSTGLDPVVFPVATDNLKL